MVFFRINVFFHLRPTLLCVTLIGALVMSQGISAEEVKDCGQSWNYIHRACYLFVMNKEKSWDDAQKYCQAEDGDLVSISDMMESTAVITALYRITLVCESNIVVELISKCFARAIKNHLKTFDSSLMWWVGLHRLGRTPVFEWLDKTSFSSRITPWKLHEPNDRGGQENCVEMSFDGKLNDRNCTTVLRPFICERHNITPRPVEHTTIPITTTSNTEPATQTVEIQTTVPTTSTTFISTSVGSTLSSTGESSITTESELEQTTDYLKSTQATAALHTRLPFTPRSSPSTASVIDNRDTEPSKSRDKDTTTHTTKVDVDSLDERLDRLYEQYKGCFMLDSKRDRKIKFLYTPGESTCPEVHASRITWPGTTANEISRRPCHSGEGLASFYCGGDPVCWRNQPDMDECASPKFKAILKHLSTTEKVEEANATVATTKELADITKRDDVSADDVVATSKVFTSLATSGAASKFKDEEEIKNVVLNVMNAGSNLVDGNKTQVWSEMDKREKVRSATSLMVAMETATAAMAEQFDKPTLFVEKNKNIELQVRVLNVSSESKETDNVVYKSEDSDSSFTIPMETLKTQFSQGGLAKVVFMTHYSMGDILSGKSKDDSDNGSDDEKTFTKDTETKESQNSKQESTLATHILSVSIGGASKGGRVKLLQNITFTMTHLKPVPDGYTTLCSFLEVDQNSLGEWSQDGCHAVMRNASHTTCECNHMTNFAVLMSVQKVEISEVHQSLLKLATIVGCVISCICLLAAWITFTCFTTLQGERNSIHKNLAVCLFVAELLFLVGIDQTQNRMICGFIAGFLHYFFLAAFLWMFLEGVHIILMLTQVFDASKSRLPYYYTAAYAPPILIIAVSAGLFYDGYGTDKYCWLSTDRYFIWSFAGPVAVILVVNAVILTYALTMVCRHSEYVFSGKEKNTAGGIRSWIQGAFALEVLLGLTWIFGYFFINSQTLPIAYIFTVLNSLQGLFIFCFHCLLNKKARKEYRRVMKVKRTPSTTTSGTGTHTLSLGNKYRKHDHSLDIHGPTTSSTNA